MLLLLTFFQSKRNCLEQNGTDCAALDERYQRHCCCVLVLQGSRSIAHNVHINAAEQELHLFVSMCALTFEWAGTRPARQRERQQERRPDLRSATARSCASPKPQREPQPERKLSLATSLEPTTASQFELVWEALDAQGQQLHRQAWKHKSRQTPPHAAAATRTRPSCPSRCPSPPGSRSLEAA